MFDFIRKPILWKAWDDGLGRELGGGHYHLKTAQDLAVYRFLRPMANKEIAEIGGGESRILRKISTTNKCSNIEKFQGADGGPAEEVRIERVRNVKVFVGEFSTELRDEEFDVVFSVSVIEHVPDEMLEGFYEDGLRILKKGGVWIHAIDVYIEDNPNESQIARFESYRKWADDNRVKPLGEVYRGPLKFMCDMASNPDQTLYNWGQVAPKLSPLRQRAQSTSVLVATMKN